LVQAFSIGIDIDKNVLDGIFKQGPVGSNFGTVGKQHIDKLVVYGLKGPAIARPEFVPDELPVLFITVVIHANLI
jgi:hypothetical protein